MAEENAKIYCGDKSSLPAGQDYTRFGTRNECLKCGFGAAMYQYRWAPADPAPMPPRRAQQGCLRSRRHANGAVRGNQFVRRGERHRNLSPPLFEEEEKVPDVEPRRPRVEPRDDPIVGPRDDPIVGPKRILTKRIIALSVWIIACVTTFVLMYKIPPSVVTTVENKKTIINWGKFIGVYLGIVAAITAVIFGAYYATRNI